MSHRRPSLSVAMIVGEHEAPEMLRGALGNLAAAVAPDELAIVTPNVDRVFDVVVTVPPWKDGDVSTVYLERAWTDDFAAARNEAFRLCTSDWILVFDCDFRLTQKEGANLRIAFEDAGDDVHAFVGTVVERLGSPDDDTLPPEWTFAPPWTTFLLVRRARDPHYVGRLHETLEPWWVAACGGDERAELVAPFQVHHYGGCKDQEMRHARNVRILRRSLDEDPDDVRAFSFLAAELSTELPSSEADAEFLDVIERGFAAVRRRPDRWGMHANDARRLAVVYARHAIELGRPPHARELVRASLGEAGRDIVAALTPPPPATV